ncbi:MAG TPA: hypothetical protein PL187_04070 [Caldilinea sp.]|nr:hypothetical protein [Caldilinea sp.]
MTTNNTMLDQEQEFDAGLVDSIDQSSVEGGGPSYPLIQWVYANVKEKKHGGMDYLGGLFIKGGKVDEAALLAAGWEKTERTFESGASEEGFWKREAALSIICQRRRWEVTPADGQRLAFGWDKFDAAKAAGNGKTPHGRNQYLVLIKGLEAQGPMVLTMKGAGAQAFESYRDAKAVLSRFANTVIHAANAASDAAAKKGGKPSNNKWPYRAFWLPLGAARNEKGEPTYTEVGKTEKSLVVLPVALALPDKAEQVELKRYYIGNALLTTVNELYDAAAEWRGAWENIKPGAAVEGAAAPDATAAAEKEADAAAAAAAAMGL